MDAAGAAGGAGHPRGAATLSAEATRALAAGDARQLARAFLPASRLGNRRDYFYARGKLASDPLYPGVTAALRGSDAPLLDLGCGLGLLAHALRHDGQPLRYHGVDIDRSKLQRAQRAAGNAGLAAATFAWHDLAAGLPDHHGSVALLDVLQYLPAEAQQRLLAGAIAMLAPGARLVIRTTLADRSARDRTTRITDLLAHLIGWMGTRPRHYPGADDLRAPLQAAGLHARFTPLYGNTPFNNWLIVAWRD
ncbi:methyltransferase [Flavobacterium sp. MXW15]|nr:methyltransferase [Flavobacterium sp. MXW15]